MSRSLSWIDPSAVASALSRAKAPTGTDAAAPRRFAAPRELPDVLPPPTPPPAAPAPAVEAAPARPHFDAARPIADRLRTLASWVEAELGPRSWYLADEEGLAVHAAGVTDTQVLGAAMLTRALRPLRGVIGREPVQAATLELEGGRTLHTLWIDTAAGRFALGLESPTRATRERLQVAAEVVRATFDAASTTEGRTNQ